MEIDRLRGERVIAVNDGYRLAPWIDCMYFGDVPWFWRNEERLLDFAGFKVTTCERYKKKPGLRILERRNSPHGVTVSDPQSIRWNLSSGGAAINLAALFGVSRIILLGFDMRRMWLCPECGREYEEETTSCPCGATVDRRHNWHKNHEERGPKFNPYSVFLKPFPRIATDLQQLGIECINATPGSALQVFPICDPEEVLPPVKETATC